MRRPLLAAILLLGCSPHDVQHRPTPPLAMPESFGGETAAGTKSKPLGRWWREFKAPELDRLVQASLRGNFDLRAAWARLAQAAAAADQAGAPRWPTLEAQAGGALNRRRFTFPAPGGGLASDTRTLTSANGSIAASYEIDLWNRLGSAAQAAALEQDAAADAVQTMAMSLAAEVAEAWLDLVQVRAQRELLAKQLETNETFVELLKLRFGQGMSSSVEVNQQRQQSLETRAQLELTVSNEATVAHRLAMLLGNAPGRLNAGTRLELPAVSPLPSAGLPSELLQRRPDIRAAQRRVEAADYRVAVAIAERYPRLSLTGSVSTEPGEQNDWDLNPIWSLVGGLTMPILDGGRRAAEVDRRRAMMAELVANYGGTVLQALVEVDNALVQERQQQKNIAQIEQRMEVASLTFEEARRRYGNGLSDFLTVLTALRSRHQVELSLLGARRQLLSHRIQLCRALGGSWMSELKPPQREGNAS